MNSKLWGPPRWDLLFDGAKYAKTPDQKKVLERVLIGMKFGGLACAMCRATHSEYIEQNPPDFDKQDPLDYLYDEKSMVNRKLEIDTIVDALGPLDAKTLNIKGKGNVGTAKSSNRARNIPRDTFRNRVKCTTCFASGYKFLDDLAVVCLNADALKENYLDVLPEYARGFRDYFLAMDELLTFVPWGQPFLKGWSSQGSIAELFFARVPLEEALTTRNLVLGLLKAHYLMFYGSEVTDKDFPDFVRSKLPMFVEPVDLSFLD